MTAGSAAVVNGERISVVDLQTASTEIAGMLDEQPGAIQTVVLGWLILGEYSVPLAQEQGVGISEEDALNVIEGQVPEDKRTELSGSTVRAVQGYFSLQSLFNLVNTKPSEEVGKVFTDLVDDVKAGGVEVNPRYGTLQMAELTPIGLFTSLNQRNIVMLQLTQEPPDWLISPDDA
jgi:hypothetical protein